MLTTVPLKPVGGLDTPDSEVMHHGPIALPASVTLADVAATATLADAITAFVATGASHILVGNSAGGARLRPVFEPSVG